MKKCLLLSLLLITGIFISGNTCLAATVGNPLDLDVPAKSAFLRQQVIRKTLDEYEQVVKIKGSLDLEYVFKRDLNGPTEIEKAELKGYWVMAKIGTTIFNRVEPYIKVGTSRLEANWRMNKAFDIEVEADPGFAWGGGVKGVIWDFDDWGLRLIGDIQYRTTEPSVCNIKRSEFGINDIGADFDIEEWQVAFVLSKKFELPLRSQSVYLVPYTGITFSDLTADVKFTDFNDPGPIYSLYDANSENFVGYLLGCDIMPNLKSSFIYSMEVRLVNEIAMTLGGTVKF